jgi:hypothetical protein
MKLTKFQQIALCNVLDYLYEEEESYYEHLYSESGASNHIFVSISILNNAISAYESKTNAYKSNASLEQFFSD